MPFQLIFKGGTECGNRLTFADDCSVIIGSAADATVRITDDILLAPRHCVVEHRPGAGHILRSLDASRPTIVNNKSIAAIELKSGDIVRVGLTVVQYETTTIAERDEPRVLPSSPSESLTAPTDPTTVMSEPVEKTIQVEDTTIQLIEATRLRGYEILNKLGHGGYGTVYRARRMADQVIVAIKALNWGPALSETRLKLFHREIRVQKHLNHEGIIRLLEDEGLHDTPPWFAIEFVEGSDLGSVVRQLTSPMPPADACAIVMQLLDALDHAHTFPPPDGPFIHRDIKPANIMVSGGPGAYRVRLADLGLAKNFEVAGLSGITRTGERRGTLEYMSPDQLRDSKYAGPLVDLHALGAVLYFCLAGRTMYPADRNTRPSDLLRMIVDQRIVPIQGLVPTLPAPIAEVIERAVGLDRVRAFHSARQMRSSLQQALAAGFAGS